MAEPMNPFASLATIRISIISGRIVNREGLDGGASGIRTDMYGPSPVRKVVLIARYPVAVMYPAC
jgi:hypothetical protein